MPKSESYKLASSSWDEREIKAINNVIEGGNYTMGKYVEEFENAFSKFFNVKYSVMVNSGSSANLLAVASLFYKNENPIKAGDEVIVPALSWSTTYAPLMQYGLKLKFVDIDLNTLNYNLASLKSAIDENTRIIFAVNILGNSNQFSEIKKYIKNKNIILLEDNCESMGSKYYGKYTGTIGKLGTFSLFYSHHISTMEGGVIVTENFELYNILKSLRAHGWTRGLSDRFKNKVLRKDKFSENFNFIYPGYNLRPLEMSGAIGLEQLKKFPDLLSNRRANAKYFIDILKKNKNFIIQREIGESSWFAFSLIISPEAKINRDRLVSLLNKNNIECRPIVAGNFVNNETIKYYNYNIHEELENANYVDTFGLYVGNHHFNLEPQLNLLKKVLEKI